MNEGATVCRIPKQSGTHGDVFAVAGLADLLASLPNVGTVTLRDDGRAFEVLCSGEPADASFDHLPANPGYPFLKTKEKVVVPAGAVDVVDYKAEKARADRFREQVKEARSRHRQTSEPGTLEMVQQDLPREDWRLLQVLNILRAHDASNGLHATIVGRPARQHREDIRAALRALARGERPQLDRKVNTVQLFTPTAAKGYARLKPDSTDRNDKTKEQWAEPFIEWLKIRGYFATACPFILGGDIRLLCPIPRDISAEALRLIVRDVRKARVWGGPPKVDALVVLRLAMLLVRRSEDYHDPSADVLPGLFLKGRTPADAVSGIMTTHYQSLGTAHVVSAMSTLALPGWFSIESRSDAEAWLAVLSEHERIVADLKDDRSDEIGLLVAYRRFLEGRGEDALWRLVEFMESYGPFLIRAREQRRHVRAFTSTNFGRIAMAMAPRLRDVLDDAGFQAVAAAVRRATVNAQFQKANKAHDHREVRYELLHELRRRRSLPGNAPLIEAVAEFISKYNSENARRREQGKGAPKNVTTDEFASFTALVDQYGASVVGALLCAYGSCREPRDLESAEPSVSEGESAGAETVA